MGWANLILSLFLIHTSIAQAAFEIKPLILKLEPSGPPSSTTMSILNVGSDKIKIRLQIVKREPDLNGKEEHKVTPDIEKLFRVSSDQLLLKPQESVEVSVSYIGDPQIKSELAFRLIAEELASDGKDQTTNNKSEKAAVATRYVASIYVTPSGSNPEIKVSSKIRENPRKELILMIENTGTAHQIIKAPQLKIIPLPGGKETLVNESDLAPLIDQNILAGSKRRFTFPFPENLPGKAFKIELDFDKK